MPAVAFWGLDGYFLWQERLFRALYDHVRRSRAALVLRHVVRVLQFDRIQVGKRDRRELRSLRMKITAQTKANMATALLTLAVNVPVSVLTSYCTTSFTAAEAAQTQEAQEKRDREYVETLQEAIGVEGEQNAKNIQRWLPRLVDIAKDLESFVNGREASRPGVNPGYGMLTETALSEAVESRVATRYLPWCVLSALNSVRNRLSEGNAVKRDVDAALARYTATLPGPPAEAYTAAALLHARIEQLVEIYGPMPRLLKLLRSLVAVQDCTAETPLLPAESG